MTRDVYEDDDGRQWITGYDGERVYGVWLAPPDEPVIAEGVARHTPSAYNRG